MKKSLCLIIIIAVCLFSYSCREKNYLDANIVDRGEAESEGCRYFVQVGLMLYSPLNLPDEFKVNNLLVKVDFQKEGKGVGCYIDSHFDSIKINKIKKR
jgi:hypothetical protein